MSAGAVVAGALFATGAAVEAGGWLGAVCAPNIGGKLAATKIKLPNNDRILL